ncbi:MAG: class 1 fructose-bisphosphatase [Gemmatimonadaceae bacterium]
MIRALLGSQLTPRPDVLARYPELRAARFRLGGLPVRVGGWLLGRGRVDAVTLGRTIFVAREIEPSAELLLHELRHVQQFGESKAFPFRYIWETLRRGYFENLFERDAREFATRRVRGSGASFTKDVQVVKHTATSVVTIDRYIIEEERLHPQATGELSGILYDLALAAKMIANKVRNAGLADVLGATENSNVQGEIQQKLDVLANDIIIKAMDHGGRLCAMASEEMPDLIPIPEQFRCGKYVLLFDPLDGSSNIDVNVPVGTIFSVLRKISRGNKGEMEDLLQPGHKQVAAGYVIYGSSTMMVYTTGQGVHGFTLDPAIGEFLLSHPHIRTPDPGRYLSVNDSYEPLWSDTVKDLMQRYRKGDGKKRNGTSSRYVGSLVADFHRNLLGGGIFAYPAQKKSPKGKLRLLYEANPLGFIAEQAGGAASDGERRVLDIVPTELHQRTPLFIGSKSSVALAESMLGGALTGVGA